jgi:lysophospholipase L1-like esterase
MLDYPTCPSSLRRMPYLAAIAGLLLCLAGLAGAEGDDLAFAFARARVSGSLRVAAIGGSITQAGGGWIAPWLGQHLPGVQVAMRNAGMSATGSELGVFRLARDVIATDPDIVLIETAVNDGGMSDPETIRCVESLVRRLALLPHRPGILLVLVAARDGAKHGRHHAVGDQYGLLRVDLQAAVKARIAAGGRWDDMFSDNVHPNAAGHALYAEAIAAALAPLIDAPAPAALPPLPPVLSTLPLLLDGRMWAPGPAPGWGAEPQLKDWWDCFFLGVITAREPGLPLTIPVRGTTIGVMFALEAGSGGTVIASVDGGAPTLIPCHHRRGYEPVVLARDLAPGEHRLTLVVASAKPGPVRLGYILAAGAGADTPAAQGPWTIERLAALRLDPVPARAYRLAGPVGGFTADVDDPAAALTKPLLPEDPAAYRALTVPGPDGPVEVRRITGDDALIKSCTQPPWRGQAVAITGFTCDRERQLLIGWAADYFGRLRLNGKDVLTYTAGHGGPRVHRLATVTARAGWNDLTLTLLPGSQGFTSELLIEHPADGTLSFDDPR